MSGKEEPNVDGTTMENGSGIPTTPSAITAPRSLANKDDGDDESSSTSSPNDDTVGMTGVDDNPVKEKNSPSSSSSCSSSASEMRIATDTVMENGNEAVPYATTDTASTIIMASTASEMKVEEGEKDHLQPVEEAPKMVNDDHEVDTQMETVEDSPNNQDETKCSNNHEKNEVVPQPSEQNEDSKKMEDTASASKKRSLEEATLTDDNSSSTQDETKTNQTVHQETNDTANKKPKQQSNSGNKKHMDPKVLEIRHVIQSCCQHNDLATAMEAYERAVKEGISIEAQSFYNLLSLGDGLERTVHIGTPKVPPRTNNNKKATTPTTKSNGTTSFNTGEDSTAVSAAASAAALEAQPLLPKEIRPVSAGKRKEFAFQIKKRMDDIKLPLTETAYTALIRLLSRTRDLDAALKLVEEAEHVQQCKPKLRLYSSLLIAFCEVGELEQALALRKRIQQQQPHHHHSTTTNNTNTARASSKKQSHSQNQQPLVLAEKECTALLQCAMANDNAIVFEAILSDLAEDVLVPSKDTVAVLLEWFVSPCSKLRRQRLPPRRMSNEQDTTASLNKIKQLLEEGHSHNHHRQEEERGKSNGNDSGMAAVAAAAAQSPSSIHEAPPNMGPVVTPNGWKTSSSIPIDTTTGILQRGCLQGCALQPVQVSDRAWYEMTRMNESIVLDGKISGNQAAMFQGGKKGKLRNDFSPASRHDQWSKFCTFLNELETTQQKIPHVVLDGANIGYYQQNFSGAPKHVDYYQIDWIVRHFLNTLNQNVLLVMHQRHFAPNLMPAKFQPLVEDWERLGVLYKTPPGMNDDWFWLHAALKYKTLVVTNDEMRDHHFQMLAPRMFLRWKDRHQVHFNFGDWVNEQQSAAAAKESIEDRSASSSVAATSGNQSTKKPSRQVQLVFPEVYSRRIQRVEDGLVVPLAKRGDTNRFLDGAHEANDDEPMEETYLCIRPAPPPPEAKVDWN
jgi:mitochondrial ribonuclease P protein 3